MKCYKCGNEIKISNPICPRCRANVSFTSNNITMTSSKSVKGGRSIIFLVITLPLLTIFSICGIGFLNIFGKVNLANSILNVIFYAGIILLGLNLLLRINNKGKQLNNRHISGTPITPKSKFKFSITLTVLAIYLMVLPFITRQVIKTFINLDGIDYATTKYIEISNVKVPSLYSVVGEREVMLNIGFQDAFDEEMKISFDTLTIVYKSLSQEDIDLYKAELIQQGYTLLKLNDDENAEVFFYVKNDSSVGEYIIINISDTEFTYSVGQGRYEERLKGYTVVDNA